MKIFVSALATAIALFGGSAANAECREPARVFTKEDVREMIVAAAAKDGRVPAALALAVARVESNFNTSTESSAGARGVMQIMPATARDEYGVDADTLWDAGTNIDLGIRYLGDLYEHYGRNWDAALSHYNGGALNDGVPHSYTAGYVASVNRWWRIYDDGVRTPALIASVRAAPRMSQEELDEHIRNARSRVRAALALQGAYD
jgi:soluble lytic murein transglycosylase-like protein